MAWALMSWDLSGKVGWTDMGDRLLPVTVRFTSAAYAAICEIASEHGMSMADVVRRGFDRELSNYLGNIVYMDFEQGKAIQNQLAYLATQMQQILFELRRIGVNYNQEIKLRQMAKKYSQRRAEIDQKYGKKIQKPTWKESYDDVQRRLKSKEEYQSELDTLEENQLSEKNSIIRQSKGLDMQALDRLISRYEAATGKAGETLCRMLGSVAQGTAQGR